ncbi:helix-turn-helix domain-containing protein, partial [Acinetobacter baumannii]
MELKDRIKAARKHAHLSQVQLAQAVGMTQTSISDLERGKSRATSFVAQIAGACGVNPLWLAEGRGEMLAERGQANAGPNASWLGAVESWDDETPLDADEIELPFYKEIELSGGKGSTVILQTGGRKLRFGKYTVDVVGQDGQREYFSLFETKREANQMAEQMRGAFPGATVS